MLARSGNINRQFAGEKGQEWFQLQAKQSAPSIHSTLSRESPRNLAHLQSTSPPALQPAQR